MRKCKDTAKTGVLHFKFVQLIFIKPLILLAGMNKIFIDTNRLIGRLIGFRTSLGTCLSDVRLGLGGLVLEHRVQMWSLLKKTDVDYRERANDPDGNQVLVRTS